jgi:putative glutamine amidotransferase
MSIPLIGVTASRIIGSRGLPSISINEAYLQAVVRAGGMPLMIPLDVTDEALRELLPRLDGVLFSGGGDVEGARYASDAHPQIREVQPDRDRVEILLVEEAIHLRKPFLGICRGIQVINVALGGTLFPDIPSQLPEALKHDYYPDWPRDYEAHAVTLDPDSRLATILGLAQLEVNSLHHQSIHQPAPGLWITAYAPDGIVEAVELPGHPFGIAVQWHPEWMQDHESMQALFRAFVQAASHIEQEA